MVLVVIVLRQDPPPPLAQTYPLVVVVVLRTHLVTFTAPLDPPVATLHEVPPLTVEVAMLLSQPHPFPHPHSLL